METTPPTRNDWNRTHRLVQTAFGQHLKRHKTMPSIADVARQTGLHRNTVSKHIQELMYSEEAMDESQSLILVLRMVFDRLALESLEGNFRARAQLMRFLSNPKYAAMLSRHTSRWFSDDNGAKNVQSCADFPVNAEPQHAAAETVEWAEGKPVAADQTQHWVAEPEEAAGVETKTKVELPALIIEPSEATGPIKILVAKTQHLETSTEPDAGLHLHLSPEETPSDSASQKVAAALALVKQSPEKPEEMMKRLNAMFDDCSKDELLAMTHLIHHNLNSLLPAMSPAAGHRARAA